MQTEYSTFIREHGYAIISDVISVEEVKGLTEWSSRRDIPRSKAGIRHALKYPEVGCLARDPRLIKLASAALKGNAFPYRATLFDKSPNTNWLVVWHQDTALPVHGKRDVVGWGPWSIKDGVTYAHAPAGALATVIALRVHFDDSTESNGPLRVLPGTHNLGVLTDDQLHHLGKQSSPIECCVARGGVMAMSPLIVHSSAKSQSNAPRRVLHIEYATETMLEGNLKLAIT